MLVVTDKQTLRVGGEGGLAGSGEAEEDSRVLAVHIGIGGAVHRSDTLQRQVVVLHGEHTFLHLAAVPCVDDYLLTAGGVEGNTSVAVQTQLFEVLHFSLGGVVDNEVRLKVLQLFSGRLNEHVLDEVSLPCYLQDEANSQVSSLVSAAECVHYVQFLATKLFNGNVLYLSPNLFRHGVVVVLVTFGRPPYFIVALSIVHDVFVFRRAAGEDAGHHVHCTQLGLLSGLIAFEGGVNFCFVQLFIGRVVSNHRRADDAILG